MSSEPATTDLIPVKPAEELPEVFEELSDELLPRITDQDEINQWNEIDSDYKDALSDRTEWENNLARWDEQYYGDLPEKNWPWPGCSNFHVPLTMVGVETLKPRLVESVLGDDLPIIVRPTESTDEEKQERTELFLNWQVKTELRIEDQVADSAHRFLLPGTVFAKILWKTEDRKIKAIRTFPTNTTLEDIFKNVLGADIPQEPKKVGNNEWEIETRTTGGAKRKVKIKFRFADDLIHVLVEKEERVFEGPEVSLIDAEDIIAPVKGGGDVQKLPWIIHRTWLNENDIRRKVRMGRFYKDVVDELLVHRDPPGDSGDMESQEVRDVRARHEGTEDEGASSVRNMQYEILEDYRSFDIDGDGFDEEIIRWVTPSLPGRLLGWDYLDNVYAHGLRPFVIGRFFPIPGKLYGLSFPEVVRSIQEEINTIHNQRVDSGTLQNTPGYFFRSSSTHQPDRYRMRPGEGIPIDNPQTDILMTQWNGSPVFGQNEESLLYQYFERLTGLTDLALGRQPNRVGATRTATGVASLLSEAGLRFKTAMLAFQRFWRDIFAHVLALDQQYLPPGKEFRVTGKWPEIIKIHDRSEIAGKYDIRLATTTESLNRQVMREDATVKLNTALNPAALQLGLIGPKGLYRLFRRFYIAYGESDPDMVLEPVRDQIVRTPEQELAIWISGGDVDPTMAENLGQHIQAHQMMLADPIVRNTLGPTGVRKVTQHLAATIQMAQMQAVIQQMTQGKGGGPGASPVAGQQAMNAQVGRMSGSEGVTGAQSPAGFGQGGGSQGGPSQ